MEGEPWGGGIAIIAIFAMIITIILIIFAMIITIILIIIIILNSFVVMKLLDFVYWFFF